MQVAPELFHYLVGKAMDSTIEAAAVAEAAEAEAAALPDRRKELREYFEVVHVETHTVRYCTVRESSE